MFSYMGYGPRSEIKLPYVESLTLLAKSSNGTYMPNDYSYVNYTSVYRNGNAFYGCGESFCFNATNSSQVAIPYQNLISILNLSLLEGLNSTRTVHLANAYPSSINGNPCEYLSRMGVNSSQQYQTLNITMCISDSYHIQLWLVISGISGTSITTLLNFTAESVNAKVTQSQVNLPEQVNNSSTN